jgi:hypothetical protein
MAIDALRTGFVAYASGSPALDETVAAAVEQINASGVVEIMTWRQLKIGGQLLLDEICDSVSKADIFIADVSALNPNVLFELGFAVARRKRIWLLLDPSQANARTDFNRFQLLSTIGFREFTNSNEIVRRFFEDEPYKTPEKTVYRDLFDSPVRSPQSKILYL